MASDQRSPTQGELSVIPVIVVAPDSFKGSLTSTEAAQAIAQGLRRVWPQATLRLRPLADGGEGTLDALLSAGGKRCTARVSNAAGQPIDAAYGVLDDATQTAIIEVAQVVGITQAANLAVPVSERSTVGVGELLNKLLYQGSKRVLLGLGGSCTNEGGAGLLASLGARLLDAKGQPIPPTLDGLTRCVTVDCAGLHPNLQHAELLALADVNNPLCGKTGATLLFGAQKGIPPEHGQAIDEILLRFALAAEQAMGRSAKHLPGAGAAGGLGFALQLLGARMTSGAAMVADWVRLDEALQGADWLITGEGQSDRQTLLGKTPFIAASYAQQRAVPATLLSGTIDRTALTALSPYFAGCFALPFGPLSLPEALTDAANLLADSAEQVARLWQTARP